jgi:uncharacterized membrane protein
MQMHQKELILILAGVFAVVGWLVLHEITARFFRRRSASQAFAYLTGKGQRKDQDIKDPVELAREGLRRTRIVFTITIIVLIVFTLLLVMKSVALVILYIDESNGFSSMDLAALLFQWCLVVCGYLFLHAQIMLRTMLKIVANEQNQLN